MTNYVVFSVDNQMLAVSTESVERIMNYKAITKVFGLADYIEGVINYNSQIITVINLKRLLMKNHYENLPCTSQIIIINFNQDKAAILVDEVIDIQSSGGNSVYLGLKNQHILGMVELGDKIVNVINPQIAILTKAG